MLIASVQRLATIGDCSGPLAEPNLIPLTASTVRQIVEAIEPFAFERLYGAWWGKRVLMDAKTAVLQSAARYIEALEK